MADTIFQVKVDLATERAKHSDTKAELMTERQKTGQLRSVIADIDRLLDKINADNFAVRRMTNDSYHKYATEIIGSIQKSIQQHIYTDKREANQTANSIARIEQERSHR